MKSSNFRVVFLCFCLLIDKKPILNNPNRKSEIKDFFDHRIVLKNFWKPLENVKKKTVFPSMNYTKTKNKVLNLLFGKRITTFRSTVFLVYDFF